MSFIFANIKMTLRNKQLLFWSLFFPIFMMIMFGAMFSGGNRKFDVGLVNKSESKIASKLVESLKKIDALKISQKAESIEKKELGDGNRVAVIVLPEKLSDPSKPVQALNGKTFLKPKKNSPIKVTIFYNENKNQDAQVVSTVLNQLIGKFNQKISHTPEIISLKKQAYNSKNLKYIDFLLPGLLAMSLMMGGIMGIAVPIATLREKGVLKRLLATPLNPAIFFTAQVITRLLIALIQSALMITIAVLGFGAHFNGDIFTFMLVLIFGACVFLIFGLILASIAKNADTVEPMSRAVTMPMLFLGGVLFPIDSMPAWLQPISRALPLSYMSDALRKVVSEGASLYAIRIDLLVLLIWGIFGFIIASKIFRWE